MTVLKLCGGGWVSGLGLGQSFRHWIRRRPPARRLLLLRTVYSASPCSGIRTTFKGFKNKHRVTHRQSFQLDTRGHRTGAHTVHTKCSRSRTRRTKTSLVSYPSSRQSTRANDSARSSTHARLHASVPRWSHRVAGAQNTLPTCKHSREERTALRLWV